MFSGNSMRPVIALLCASLVQAQALAATAAAAGPQSLRHDRFGEVTIYGSSSKPRELVLFISGDGGWNLGVIAMAQRLADKGAVVAGVDVRHYLAELEK